MLEKLKAGYGDQISNLQERWNGPNGEFSFKAMGFDVVYLPPIHPIGLSHRKGRNNSTTCRPGDPGSPWAIGSEQGGHLAVHPELGTLEDFQAFRRKAEKLGLVNRALAGEELMPFVYDLARHLATQVSPRSVAIMKRQIRESYFQSYADSLAVADAEMEKSFATHDFKEGVASFVERRAPAFTGK